MGAFCRASLLTAVAVRLAGCTVGPDYESPAVAVPQAFGTAPLTSAAAGPFTDDFVRWWQVLRDPQLSWLIEQAIAGNPDIEIALMRVQEARLQQNDFGRLDALVDIQEMRTREVLVRYKKTIIAAVEEVDLAIRQYRLELQRWRAWRAALEEVRHAVTLTAERYERGDSDFRALLDIQRRNYALEDQVAIAAQAAVLRYIAFYKAMGGGWELYDELPPVPPVQPAVIASVRRVWH